MIMDVCFNDPGILFEDSRLRNEIIIFSGTSAARRKPRDGRKEPLSIVDDSVHYRSLPVLASGERLGQVPEMGSYGHVNPQLP